MTKDEYSRQIISIPNLCLNDFHILMTFPCINFYPDLNFNISDYWTISDLDMAELLTTDSDFQRIYAFKCEKYLQKEDFLNLDPLLRLMLLSHFEFTYYFGDKEVIGKIIDKLNYMSDRYYLARFKNAQDFGVYEKALSEIKNGRKFGHWMWFIFPQMRGFGHSRETWFYGITCADEARAYLYDPILGGRLREICEALLNLEETDPAKIFEADWIKLGSSMTLFDHISPYDIFRKVLDKFFAGSSDLTTLSMLRNKN